MDNTVSQNTTPDLSGLSVAILAAGGVDQTSLSHVQRALLKAGATFKVVSTDSGLIAAWDGTGWGHSFTVGAPISTTLGSDYDGLVIPGGSRSVAKLAASPHASRILRAVLDGRRPIAAFAEGVALLTGVSLRGRRVAVGEAAMDAAIAAGARVAQESLVVDGSLVTASESAALTGMIEAFMQALAETRSDSEAA